MKTKSKNNVYLITFNKVDYDQFNGFVVVAKDENEVISIVKEKYPDTDWYRYINWDEGYEIKEVSFNKSQIIFESFNAG